MRHSAAVAVRVLRSDFSLLPETERGHRLAAALTEGLSLLGRVYLRQPHAQRLRRSFAAHRQRVAVRDPNDKAHQ
jgi:hypothetical protein